MGWIEPLRGKTVGLDTTPLIYYIEDHTVYADRLPEFFEAVVSGEIRVVTSTVTLLEVLVQPLKKGNNSLATSTTTSCSVPLTSLPHRSMQRRRKRP